MGGSGIAGDVIAAVVQRRAAGAGHRAEAVPHAGVRRAATRSRSRSRTRATPRRRCRWRAARPSAVRSSSRSRAAARSSELARDARRAARAVPRRAILPRAAIGALVAPLCRRAVPHRPRARARTRCSCARRSSSRAAATRAGPRSRARRTRPASSRAGSAARSRSIYGGGALGAVAAYRWKCDVNENAKAPAFWHAYPELDHNEICAWGQHGDVTRQLHDARRAAARLRARAARGAGSTSPARSSRRPCTRCSRVEAEGEGRLAQLLDLMYLGDWVSLLPRARQRRRSRPDRRDLRTEATGSAERRHGADARASSWRRSGELVAAQRAEFETGPVHADATLDELRAALGGPTPETRDRQRARSSDALAAEAAPGVVGIPGPRYFGFVIGGSHPGGARRRLADERLGQQRRPLRRRARGVGDRRDRGPLGRRPARAPARPRRSASSPAA